MKIAYVVNQYSKVSYSFFRREIVALERQSFEVERISVRGWGDPLVDSEDQRERWAWPGAWDSAPRGRGRSA
jgi:colanic acid/amylovoran biosynthesis glycosyltransferase